MSLRRLSKMWNKDEYNSRKPKTSLSFDLIKVNKYGTKQQRTLNLTDDGVANMKGKNVQWYFPARDLYSVHQDPQDDTHLTLRVLREYDFEAQSPQQAAQIVQVFYDLYTDELVKSHGSVPTPNLEIRRPRQQAREPSSPVVSPRSPSTDAKEISIKDFDLIKVIGQGSFSKVCLVKKKDNGKLYAMKVLQKSELKKRNQVEHTNTERRIMSKYTHPFLVKLYYSFQSQDKLYMCLEYVDGGELFYHLKRARRFPENLACFYAAEIVLAISFLHNNDIIYRDLKPENILVDPQGHLKLTDFGLSKAGISSVGGSTEGSKTRTFCGTPDYLAPEIIQGSPHGKAVDWWGLGVLLYEMLTGQPPFRGKNRNELYEQVLKVEVIFPEHVSQPAKNLVSALLAKKPEDRLGAQGVDAVMNHPFFKAIQWDKLLQKEVDPPFKPIQKENSSDVAPEGNLSPQELSQIMPSTDSLSTSPSFHQFSFSSDTLSNVDSE